MLNLPVNDAGGADDLHELVERKLTRVFGFDRANRLLRSTLADLRLPAVETTDDLECVAALLQTHDGFEQTAGAMLAVMAAVRRSARR